MKKVLRIIVLLLVLRYPVGVGYALQAGLYAVSDFVQGENVGCNLVEFTDNVLVWFDVEYSTAREIQRADAKEYCAG